MAAGSISWNGLQSLLYIVAHERDADIRSARDEEMKSDSKGIEDKEET